MGVDGENITTGGNVLSAQETLEHIANALNRAAEAYSGKPVTDPDDPEVLLDVFPNPKAPGMDRRADVVSEDLGEREAAFRAAMADLGPGRRHDHDAAAAGLNPGFTAVFETGTGPKTWTELEMMVHCPVAPGVVILAATKERKLKPDERTATAKLLDIPEDRVGDDEYTVTHQIAWRRLPGFKPLVEPLPYAYDAEGNVSLGVDDDDSLFTHIGTLDNGKTPVVMMRVDRVYKDSSRQEYQQPGDHAKMLAIARLIQRDGGSEVAFYTSATYRPSRIVSALRAARSMPGMRFEVLSYGTEHFAATKREAVTNPKIGQLAGEAYRTAEAYIAFLDESEEA